MLKFPDHGNKRKVRVIDAETGEDIVGGLPVWMPGSRYKPYGDLAMTISQEGIDVIARCKALKGEHLRVFLAMLADMNRDGYVFITQKRIEEKTGIKQPNVANAIKKLRELGIIERGKPKLGNVRCYRINPEYGWKGKLYDLAEELKKRAKENRLTLHKLKES